MAFNAGAIEATLTLNRNPFTAGLAAARSQAESFARRNYQVKMVPNLDQEALGRIRTTLNRTVGRVTLRPSLDREAFERIKTTINRTVGNITLRPQLDRAAFDRIRNTIDRSVGRITVRVNLDRESLLRVRAQIEALRPEVNVRVRYDRETLNDLIARLRAANGEARTGARDFDNYGNSGGRAFRHMDGTVRAVLATLPLLLPAAGSAITGIVGLVGSLTSAFVTAGAGIGAFALVGTSVFKSINEAANATTAPTAKAIAALKQVQTARSSYDDAVESSAQANIQASRRIEDAERSLRTAQTTAVRAQEDLNQARADAVEELQDLQLTLRGAALSEEQAVLDLEEAQLRFNEALRNGTTGNELKQLELNVRQAQLAVDESRESYGDAKQASDNWAMTGIEGSQGVRDAQYRLNDANAEVAAREQDLADARADQTRIMRDGQEKIAEALQGLRDAEAAYTAETALNSVARTAAFNRSVDALRLVKTEYEALVSRTQDPVADAFTANFQAAAQFLRTLDPLVRSTSEAFTRIGDMAREYFASPHWANFVKLISDNMVPTLTRLFEILAFATRGVLNLAIAFQPMADWLLQAVVDGMKDFATWTENLAGDKQFHDWIETAKDALGRLMEFLGSVVRFIFEFSYALAPLGTAIFNTLAFIFNGLSRMPPEWLNGIALGLSAIFAALVFGGSGPVALAIGAVVGVAGALTTLYNSNEQVRTSVDGFMNTLRDRFMPIWEQVRSNFDDKIVPAFENARRSIQDNFGPVLERLWSQVETDIIPALSSFADTLTGKLIPAFLDWMAAAAPIAAWFAETFGGSLIYVFEGFVRSIEASLLILSGVFRTVTGLITGDWDMFWSGLREIMEGALGIIGAAFGVSLDEIHANVTQFGIDTNNTWVDIFGGMRTEQDGSQREIEGSFNEFFRVTGESFSTMGTNVKNAWVEMFGGIKTEQDGSQTEIEGDLAAFLTRSETDWKESCRIFAEDWTNFWADVKLNLDNYSRDVETSWRDFSNRAEADWKESVRLAGNDWVDFWGGVKTEQDGSQSEVQGSLWRWLGDMTRGFSEWWQQVVRDWEGFWYQVELATGRAGDRIGAAWRRIGNFFRTPIQWVIDFVINGGILGAWNTVMGWIGAPGLSVGPIGPLPMFASGGPISGGIPNRDSVPIMTMPGEYVLSKRAVQNMGGVSAVEQIHQDARMGALTGLGASRNDGMARQHLMRAVSADDLIGRGFAYGGVRPHVAVAGQEIERMMGPMPGGIAGVGGRPNASDHPSGHALDFMTLNNKGLGDRISGHLLANAKRLLIKYLIWQQQINSGGGWTKMPDRGSITANHYDHVHASFLAAGGPAGRDFAGGGYTPVTETFWQQLGGRVIGLFSGLFNGAIPGLGGPLGSAITKIPSTLISKVIQVAQGKLEGMFTQAPGESGNVGTGVARWRPLVEDMLRLNGQPLTLANTTLRRMNQESAGNPRAINNWDINAKRGIPSKGLMQVIDPTFQAYRHPGLPNDIWDPAANIAASMRYALRKYGSLSAAYDRPGGYATGGLLRPGQAAYNETHANEQVLNGQQTRDFTQLVGILTELVGHSGGGVNGMLNGGGGGPLIGNLNVTTTPNASASAIIDAAMFRARAARRLGAHS